MFNLFNLFSGSRYSGGGIAPQPYTPSRSERRDTERTVKRFCQPLGTVVEKYNNILDSAGNISEATNPIRILEHKQTDKSVDEAKKEFSKGDHIAVLRSGYSHHGIYDGNGGVIEYNDSIVRYTSLHDFACGSNVYKINERAAYSENEIVSRAYSRIDEQDYNVIYNNCENFATWCRCG